MTEMKLRLGLTMMVAIFAIAATPASALFTPAGGKGSFTAGEVTFTYNSITFKCANAKGVYTISSNGGEVKTGKTTWNECKASGAAEYRIVCNGIVLRQQNKEGSATGIAIGSISETCTISEGSFCTITIGQQENQNLKAISLHKTSGGTVADVNIENMTATAEGSFCAGISEKPTHNAMEKVSIDFEGLGLE